MYSRTQLSASIKQWAAEAGFDLAGIAPVHVWREPSEPPPLVDGVRRIPDLRGLLDLA